MKLLVGLGAAAILLAPALTWAIPVPGAIVYIEDDFLPDGDLNGWTPYGNVTIRNPDGNGFDLYNPTWRVEEDKDGIIGWQEGSGGSRSFGIYKRFHDEYIEGGEKHIQAWVRMLSSNWDFSAAPNALTVRLGKDPFGGTDPASPNIIWTEPYWGDWTQLELVQPCVEADETIFIQVDGFLNGYAQVLIDRVDVWQTPEPSALLLLGLG
ncbi:MAG TPA: hypothetical protein PL151_18520, partial [Phycisphaerae bacterium]|nr:hypothetical protein [Phycisphaerae bacterium]